MVRLTACRVNRHAVDADDTASFAAAPSAAVELHSVPLNMRHTFIKGLVIGPILLLLAVAGAYAVCPVITVSPSVA